MRIFRSRLFFKYFLLFSVNLIFFILILSYLIYFVFVQSFLSNQFFQANVATLNEVCKAAEGYLRKADDVAKYFSIINKELLSYQYKNIVFDSNLVDFLDRQKKQMLLNDSIFSVYAYFPDRNLVMDFSKTALYSPLPKGGEASAAVYPRFYDNGWTGRIKAPEFNREGFILLDTRKVLDSDLQNTGSPGISIVEDVDAVTVIRACNNMQAGSRGYVIVNLDESFVSNYITEVNANPMQNTFIVNSSGVVVSNADKSLLGKNLADSQYIRDILASTSVNGHFVSRIDGRNMEVMYVKSGYIGWSYVSVVPLSYITQDLHYLNSVIVLIVALILASALASVFIMTRRITSPIEGIFQKIRAISTDGKVQMVKSEVKMVNGLLDVIKENYDHLGKLVLENYNLLKYDFLNRLIAGECTQEQMEVGFDEYGIAFERGSYLVVNIMTDNFEDVLKRFKLQDIYVMNHAVINIAEEYLNEKYIAVGTSLNRNSSLIIVNTPGGSSREELEGTIAVIIDMVQKYLQMSVSAGVGNPYPSVDGLKDSTDEAGIALQNRLNKGNASIVFYEDINFSADMLMPDKCLEQIIGAVRAGQKDKCLSALDAMVERIAVCELSRQKVENLFIELLLIIHKQLNYQDRSFEEICKHSFPDILSAITAADKLEGLKRYMGEILGMLSDHFGSSKKSHNEELVGKVMRYIDTHYHEGLSLASVASMVKLTPQYVRKLIKDITGLNLLDYLTEVRMRKAEEMLARTDLSVQEVAEKVGYDCYRTFLLHFREHTGMIPTQYRKAKSRLGAE